MITTVSIHLALRRFSEITCGTTPSLIRVTARLEGSRRVYRAVIPKEYRDEVCAFLRRRLDSRIHLDDSFLILTEEQAEALLALAYNRDIGETAGTAR
jgi:hypothetical protein